MIKKVSIAAIVIIALFVLLLGAGNLKNGELLGSDGYSQNGQYGSGYGSGGSLGGGTAPCYIPDSLMRNTGSVSSGQEAARLLGDKRVSSPAQIQRLDQIISLAKASGINPALPIGIWGQEQGFDNVNGRTFGVMAAGLGFSNQLPEMIRYLNRDTTAAMAGARVVTDSHGNYTAQSVFDYVMQRYTPTYGTNWDNNDPRRATLIGFLKKLMPGGLVCNDAPTSAIANGSLAQKIAQIAEGEIGNGPLQKYYQGSGASSGTAWCAYFATWVFNQSGAKVPVMGGAKASFDYIADKNIKIPANGTPLPGDYVLIKSPSNLISGMHVGIVVGVNGNKVTTVEGNANHKVEKNTYTNLKMSNETILGYARFK